MLLIDKQELGYDTKTMIHICNKDFIFIIKRNNRGTAMIKMFACTESRHFSSKGFRWPDGSG